MRLYCEEITRMSDICSISATTSVLSYMQWFLVPYCWLVAGKSRRFPSVDVIEKEICALDLVELAQESDFG